MIFVDRCNDTVDQSGKLFLGKWSDYHLDSLTSYSLEQLAAYVFAVDAVNFCFWPKNPTG